MKPGQPKDYYWYSLRITPPNGKPKYFRKVTRSDSFPKALLDIAQFAFDANKYFDTQIQVEYSSKRIPIEKVEPLEIDHLVDDESYVESTDTDKYEDNPELET